MNSEVAFTNKELSLQDLPSVESVTFHGHPRRYLYYLLITILTPFQVFLPASLILFIFGVNIWAWVLGIGWFVISSLILSEEVRSFKIRGYALREHDITYRKGWLFYSKITVPFNRIQHCEIVQGPMAQLFDLAELKIYTAGGAVSDLAIGGLLPDEAHQVREYIAKVSANYD